MVNIKEYICIRLQVTSSVKLKIGWIHITIKIRCHKTLKISSRLYFSGLFKLGNMLGWGLFLRDLIPLRGCEKRGYEKILNTKISFWLFSTIQNCSATILLNIFKNRYHYQFCPLLRPERNNKAIWYNVNIAQTNFMRFIGVHIFNKKYSLLNCVIYRLTLVFLIEAMDLFFWGIQE